MQRCWWCGVTLVELVIVMVVTGILFVTTPPLLFHGVKTMVFLPKALAVNHVATEVLHQIVEGGFSILQTTPARGLRFANRTLPTGGSSVQPAIWLAEDKRIGFLTADGQYILIRLDDTVVNNEVITRSFPPTSSTCSSSFASLTPENIPYHAQGSVRILPTVRLFRYYNQSGLEVNNPWSCPPPSTIRRVDIAFRAQTGTGNFDEGNAREDITSSVAIRVP